MYDMSSRRALSVSASKRVVLKIDVVRLEVDRGAVAAERADLLDLARAAMPFAYVCSYSKPSRRTVAMSFFDSALTTDAPTPCRPPECM